jgi:hypothetical protein
VVPRRLGIVEAPQDLVRATQRQVPEWGNVLSRREPMACLRRVQRIEMPRKEHFTEDRVMGFVSTQHRRGNLGRQKAS